MQADESGAGFLEDLRVLEDALQVLGVEAVVHELAESYRERMPHEAATGANLAGIAAAARDTPLVPPTDREADGKTIHAHEDPGQGAERHVLERQAQAWMSGVLRP